jgi:hypothetical protein
MNEVVLVERLLERLTRAEQRCRDLERRQRRLVLGLFLILLIPLVAVLSGYHQVGTAAAQTTAAQPAVAIPAAVAAPAEAGDSAKLRAQLLDQLPADKRAEVIRFEEQVQWLGAYMKTVEGFEPGAAVALFLAQMSGNMAVMPEMSSQMQLMSANMAAIPAILAELRAMNAQMSVITRSMDSTMGRAGAMMPWMPFAP